MRLACVRLSFRGGRPGLSAARQQRSCHQGMAALAADAGQNEPQGRLDPGRHHRGTDSAAPRVTRLYRTHLLGPRLAELRALIERARARNELRTGLETDIACGMIAGPLFIYYLAVLAEADLELAEDPAEQMVRAILRAIAK